MDLAGSRVVVGFKVPQQIVARVYDLKHKPSRLR
jgi:hypothetical protein